MPTNEIVTLHYQRIKNENHIFDWTWYIQKFYVFQKMRLRRRRATQIRLKRRLFIP